MRKFGLLILFAGLALAATTMAQTTAVSKRGVLEAAARLERSASRILL